MNNMRNSARSLVSCQSVVSTKSRFDNTISFKKKITIFSSVLSLASTQRKLNRNDFAKCYVDICHLQHHNPLQVCSKFFIYSPY